MFSIFLEYEFLRNALIGTLLLGFSSVGLGFFLHYRRLILATDALSHGLLPGVAIGFWFFGLSMTAMTVFGFIAGLLVVGLSVLSSKWSQLKEDSTLSGFYILSLAFGVFLVSLKGSPVDLYHFLFGQILSITSEQLIVLAVVELIVLSLLFLIYKPLIKMTLDEDFARFLKIKTNLLKFLFMTLVIAHLVVSFQIFGTLLSVGFLILPILIGQLFFKKISALVVGSLIICWVCSLAGLLMSDYFDLPTSPTLILCFGVFFLAGLFNKVIFQKGSL